MLGESFADKDVEATGGGFRAEAEGSEVEEAKGLVGSVFDSGESADMTGFRRGEAGPSFRTKRPAVVVPGLMGDENWAGEVESVLAG